MQTPVNTELTLSTLLTLARMVPIAPSLLEMCSAVQIKSFVCILSTIRLGCMRSTIHSTAWVVFYITVSRRLTTRESLASYMSTCLGGALLYNTGCTQGPLALGVDRLIRQFLGKAPGLDTQSNILIIVAIIIQLQSQCQFFISQQ